MSKLEESVKNKKKPFTALLVLSGIITLALIVLFLVNKISSEDKTVVEVIKKNITIYVSGLSALFIILFYLFFWAFRKLLVALAISIIFSFAITLFQNKNIQIETLKEDHNFSNNTPSISSPENDIAVDSSLKLKNRKDSLIQLDKVLATIDSLKINNPKHIDSNKYDSFTNGRAILQNLTKIDSIYGTPFDSSLMIHQNYVSRYLFMYDTFNINNILKPTSRPVFITPDGRTILIAKAPEYDSIKYSEDLSFSITNPFEFPSIFWEDENDYINEVWNYEDIPLYKIDILNNDTKTLDSLRIIGFLSTNSFLSYDYYGFIGILDTSNYKKVNLPNELSYYELQNSNLKLNKGFRSLKFKKYSRLILANFQLRDDQILISELLVESKDEPTNKQIDSLKLIVSKIYSDSIVNNLRENERLIIKGSDKNSNGETYYIAK